jgi:hypothetical protein
MIGLWDYYSMSGDETAGNYLKEWGKSYKCVSINQQCNLHTEALACPCIAGTDAD